MEVRLSTFLSKSEQVEKHYEEEIKKFDFMLLYCLENKQNNFIHLSKYVIYLWLIFPSHFPQEESVRIL